MPLIAFLIYFSPDLITWLDPSSAPIHVDFWQHVLFACLITMLFSEFSFGYIAINHPNLFKWYTQEFDNLERASPWLVFAYVALVMLTMAMVLLALT